MPICYSKIAMMQQVVIAQVDLDVLVVLDQSQREAFREWPSIDNTNLFTVFLPILWKQPT
jgi:hypothetical protein